MVFDKLITQANIYLHEGPFSVTDKTTLEFSKDPHDYISGRLYWWKDGDTYIRRDGQPNPENQGPKFDRQRLDNFIIGTITLFLAYKQFNDEKYANRATEFIRVWFIRAETKMNPHLEFSQVGPAQISLGVGIIDTYDFYYLLDVIESLVKNGFFSKHEIIQLQMWFKDFIVWLEQSESGKKERSRPNNHGTSYYLQIVRYLIFTNQKFKAFKYLWHTKRKHIMLQITKEGRQPGEEGRTKSLYYHWYNLTMIMHLCRLGTNLGLNLYSYQGRLQAAFKLLLPFLEDQSDWLFEQIGPLNQEYLLEPIYFGMRYFELDYCADYMSKNKELYALYDIAGPIIPPTLFRKFM